LRSEEFSLIPPDDLLLASLVQQGNHFLCISTCEIFGNRPRSPLRSTHSFSYDFARARGSLPQADQWAMSQISLPDNGTGLAASLIAGSAIAVSDGSFKDGRGTAAFVIEDCIHPNNLSQAIGVNTVPGSLEDHSAYRSELSGDWGVISAVECICKAHGVTSGSIEVGLDGEQAMKVCEGHWTLHAGQPDFDLLQDICTKLSRSPLTWHWRWIEGHQDDGKTFKELDRWAQLNVICDGLAKEFWNLLTQ
jgi:hypothetical protein